MSGHNKYVYGRKNRFMELLSSIRELNDQTKTILYNEFDKLNWNKFGEYQESSERRLFSYHYLSICLCEKLNLDEKIICLFLVSANSDHNKYYEEGWAILNS